MSLFDASLVPTGEVCAGKGLTASALSGDGRTVALSPDAMSDTVYQGDGIHVFDARSREPIAMIARKGEYVAEVALSHDGKTLAFVDGDTVRIVALPSAASVATFALPPEPSGEKKSARARSIVFSPTAKRMAVALDSDGRGAGLAMVDVASGKPLFLQWGLPGLGHMAFSPDESRLAHVAETGVRIVDATSGEDRVAGGRLFDVDDGALSPAGDRAVVSSSGYVSVWDTRDCSRVAVLSNTPKLRHVIVLPGGASAMALEDTRVVRIDLASGSRLAVDLGAVDAIDSWVVSPDGRREYVGLEDRDHHQQVVVVDTATMKELVRHAIPGVGPIGALIFNPDGKNLYVAAPGGLANGGTPLGDSSVVEIDAATGAPGRRFQIPGAEQSYDGAVLEKGRVIVVNGDWRERLTGKELPHDKPCAFGKGA